MSRPPRRRARRAAGAGRPRAPRAALYDGGMPGGPSATYLFALLRRARPPAVAPRSAYDEAAIERGLRDIDWVSPRALGHEAVVEHFTSAGPLLPLKLFTLFDSDERALAHVRARRAALVRALEKVAGRHEWG